MAAEHSKSAPRAGRGRVSTRETPPPGTAASTSPRQRGEPTRAPSNPTQSAFSPAALATLQRLAGNRSVASLLARVSTPAVATRRSPVPATGDARDETTETGEKGKATHAAEHGSPATVPRDLSARGADARVQRDVGDAITDAWNNKRKVGVEITEDRSHGNQLADADAQPAWAGVGDKAGAWDRQVNLPDRDGTPIAWRVSDNPAALLAANFALGDGTKRTWMKWGSVRLTEDYGDYEWIVEHPADVQGVTYYRDRLRDVAQHRGELRAALGNGDHILAMGDDPGVREAVHMGLAATDAASAQITFESTDRATTKRALLEGVTTGVNRANVPDRATLPTADADVTNVVTTAAGRGAIGGGVTADRELIVAYIVGDLCHKVATSISGPDWAADVAANFKQWRTLFPKSHPTQILYQALDGAVTLDAIQAVGVWLTGQQANISHDVAHLAARKVLARTMRNEWGVQPAGAYPHDVLTAAVTGTPLPVGAPGGPNPVGVVAAAIEAFLALTQANFIPTEYANAQAALTDPSLAAADVVRSSSFASHHGSNRGFAFEDRAEVATAFPGLATTYERIKQVVNRY